MNNWMQYDSEESIAVLKRIAMESEVNSRRALLIAAQNSDTFLSHIKSLIRDAGGRLQKGQECPSFSEKMDEGTYKNLSWKIQGEQLWNTMKDMPPIDACRPGLWLYITLNAIETGAIQSHFLAAHANGQGQTGLERIEYALKTGNDLATGRMVLRRMFAVISQRTSNAIFVDIPFAKVWWQRYLAEEIAKGSVGISADDMTNFFSSQGRNNIYEELTLCMVSKLTVIADRPIRDGLMHFYYNAATIGGASIPKGFKPGGDAFKLLIKRLGVMLAWRAMGAMDVLENSRIIGECAAEIGRGEFT